MFRRKWRMTSVIMLICFLFCSCGSENTADKPSTVEISPQEEIQKKYESNPYINLTDLAYDGIYEQPFGTGVDFENAEDNNPVFRWNQYTTADGAQVCFDEEGRLRRYVTAEGLETRQEGNFAETEREATNASGEALSLKIAQNCLDTAESLTVKQMGESNCFSVQSAEAENNPEDAVTAIVELNSNGEMLSFRAGYPSVKNAIDYDYFNAKIDRYIEKRKEAYDIADYSYRVDYEQAENKVYAIYTIEFEETDGSFFCESPGFTKKIETDNSSGDVKE